MSSRHEHMGYQSGSVMMCSPTHLCVVHNSLEGRGVHAIGTEAGQRILAAQHNPLCCRQLPHLRRQHRPKSAGPKWQCCCISQQEHCTAAPLLPQASPSVCTSRNQQGGHVKIVCFAAHCHAASPRGAAPAAAAIAHACDGNSMLASQTSQGTFRQERLVHNMWYQS